MDVPVFDVTLLPGEWCEVSDVEARALKDELLAGVATEHPLHAASVRAVAVRKHLKDVVFWVPVIHQWALVHLTGRLESDPCWPSTFTSADWNELVAQL